MTPTTNSAPHCRTTLSITDARFIPANKCSTKNVREFFRRNNFRLTGRFLLRWISIWIFPISIALVGCQKALDWWQGTDTISCTYSGYVAANVENSTNQALTISFCSTKFSFPNTPQTLAPFATPQAYSTTVYSYDQDTGGMAGDNCQDRGVFPTLVGDQYPLLSPADQANYQFCYTAAASVSSSDLYSIIPIAAACPPGSTIFNQATVGCN